MSVLTKIAYWVGYYRSSVVKILKNTFILVLILLIIYLIIHFFGITIDIKKDGEILWSLS